MGTIGDRVRQIRDSGLTARFSVISLVVLALSMLLIGTWLTLRIEAAVLQRSSQLTGTYMQILMGPHLRNLEQNGWEGEEALEALDAHFRDEAVLESVPVVKVWLPDGTIVYSNNRQLIGRRFDVDQELRHALEGDVISRISELGADENLYERVLAQRLMEIYVPVRRRGDGEIHAVAEFYIAVGTLEAGIAAARFQTWGVVAGVAALVYWLLLGMVRRASRTMRDQRDKLRAYSHRLQALLEQNRRMHDRVVNAGASAMAVNERYLQRLSADLHDGAGQDLALVLLRLEELGERCGPCRAGSTGQERAAQDEFAAMEVAVRSALQDVRGLCKELRLSAVDTASVGETIGRAVRDYQRKTGRRVAVAMRGDDVDAPQPVKITLYRVAQEALMNGFQHAGGADQGIRVEVSAERVTLSVTDTGGGFRVGEAMASGRLGLVGMRDRVQLLGGEFDCVSAAGEGTTVTASLPLRLPDVDHG